MIELYQKVLFGFVIVFGFYLFARKKKDNFSEEYLELINSDKYKVKKHF